ncbi:MAG: hypothetical protein VBE63_20640 [Lamprobacter sp.]|uniref:hypothetical protein n=1 Tax=Lamprobacter sp. TaxID=3100796 RepID=UPI002B25A8C6|nr:hypothetical protein [Lamprobacter sp.]MEA3642326.1 hypothetical protein [Lamprobacter sp.]
METLTKTILSAGLQQRTLTEAQLARLLGGSAQRRYNLVNRALHRGELLRLRRGRYRLASRVASGGSYPGGGAHPGSGVHPFVLVQGLVPGAYVSFESALAFHGWIPEAVTLILAVTPDRRSRQYQIDEAGLFQFAPLPLIKGFMLEAVDRVVLQGQAALVAQPLRALLDLFCLHRWDWSSARAWLGGARIDLEPLGSLEVERLQALRCVYRHRRMQQVIDGLSSCLLSGEAGDGRVLSQGGCR